MRRFQLACLVVGVAACRTTGVAHVPVGARGDPYRYGTPSRDLLTAQDLARHPTMRTATLFDALRALRPEFLFVRYDAAGSAIAGTHVIVDGTVRGGSESLRSIHVPYVREVKLLRGPEATVRFGPEYRWGAILVTTTDTR